VQAEDRAEDTILHPTRVQFSIFNTEKVPTDIMAPPTKRYIRGCRGKVWLERK
jgi:hypothetical protein